MFHNNSVKNDPQEVNNLKMARKHIPEAVEEVEISKKIESNMRSKISTIRCVLQELGKGESSKSSWGHMKDFLCMLGIDSRIIHEKPLMHLMDSFNKQNKTENTILAKLTINVYEVLAILEENPLIASKHDTNNECSGIDSSKLTAYNSSIVKVLCALGISAYDLDMQTEAQSTFDFAKKFCKNPMQVGGILCLEASMLNKAKRFNTACSVAREAIRKSNHTNCMAYYHAAHALASMGSTSEALNTIDSGLSVIKDSRRNDLINLKEKLMADRQ
ncbi:Origin-binding F-box protein [Perkinsela sp. CCAP 1560/4]|nr:Origin-binding F-box protein [Perkinsela sp. CCAP 1560/4]|eukprot:KNH05281.1 Origin-binding F-box protein [Perkinsela sp. CCAP 1560/4]